MGERFSCRACLQGVNSKMLKIRSRLLIFKLSLRESSGLSISCDIKKKKQAHRVVVPSPPLSIIPNTNNEVDILKVLLLLSCNTLGIYYAHTMLVSSSLICFFDPRRRNRTCMTAGGFQMSDKASRGIQGSLAQCNKHGMTKKKKEKKDNSETSEKCLCKIFTHITKI